MLPPFPKAVMAQRSYERKFTRSIFESTCVLIGRMSPATFHLQGMVLDGSHFSLARVSYLIHQSLQLKEVKVASTRPDSFGPLSRQTQSRFPSLPSSVLFEIIAATQDVYKTELQNSFSTTQIPFLFSSYAIAAFSALHLFLDNKILRI